MSDVREEVAEILETIAKEGMPHPRHLDAALDAIFCLIEQQPFEPTHRHVKRGTLCRQTGAAELQCAAPVAEGTMVAFYVEQNGKAWCRPVSEFEDGRFEVLTDHILPEVL